MHAMRASVFTPPRHGGPVYTPDPAPHLQPLHLRAVRPVPGGPPRQALVVSLADQWLRWLEATEPRYAALETPPPMVALSVRGMMPAEGDCQSPSLGRLLPALGPALGDRLQLGLELFDPPPEHLDDCLGSGGTRREGYDDLGPVVEPDLSARRRYRGRRWLADLAGLDRGLDLVAADLPGRRSLCQGELFSGVVELADLVRGSGGQLPGVHLRLDCGRQIQQRQGP